MAKPPVKNPPVEVVKDAKSGVEVTVYYNRETKEFHGEVPQIGTSHGPDLQTVLREITENLVRARSFAWKGVITIDHSGGPQSVGRNFGRNGHYRSTGAHLGFQFWRSEIAPKPPPTSREAKSYEASFVERAHVLDVEAEDASSWMAGDREQGRDVHDHRGHGVTVIPYTEEAWAALFRIKEATEATYAQLVELFGKPALLETAGARLLLHVGEEPPGRRRKG